MDNGDEDEVVVTLEVKTGEAALVFTEDGLQAYLPDEMADAVEDDLPWHLEVADHAMRQIHEYALEREEVMDAAAHVINCPGCREETLLTMARHVRVAGEA